MSTPLSFCDIGARYGRTPAPQRTLEEQTGWNASQIFSDYMRKVRAKHLEDVEDAEEDALMALIDAMNAPEWEVRKQDAAAVQSLAKAGKAVSEEHGGKMDMARSSSVQAILAALSGRITFDRPEELREDQRQAEEERLEATEARGPGETRDNMERR